MRRLGATCLGLGMVVVLGACAQQPSTPSLYSITGNVPSWREGDQAKLAALAVPFAHEEYELSSTSVEQHGNFRLAMPEPVDELLTPIETLFPDTPECSDRTVQPPTAELLFVSRYRLTEESGGDMGDLQRTSDPGGDGVVSETHAFSTTAAQVTARCAFDQSTFIFALELVEGWNAYRIHTPTAPGESYQVTTAPAPFPLAWRLQPAPLEHGALPPAALTAMGPWLRDLVTPSGSSER